MIWKGGQIAQLIPTREVSFPVHVSSHLAPTLHQKLLDKHGLGSLVLASENAGEEKLKIGDIEIQGV